MVVEGEGDSMLALRGAGIGGLFERVGLQVDAVSSNCVEVISASSPAARRQGAP
jgi:hypothetical protein